jgi:hypothetical protein
MAKKTTAKKPLPSALTVGGRAQPATRKRQVRKVKAESNEVGLAQETTPTPKRQPRRAARTDSKKPSRPRAALKPAAEPEAALPAVRTPKVTFKFLGPDARRVSLSGTFNSWATDGVSMSRQTDGLWATSLDLAPGRYEYKFVVDGQWLPDPSAQENVHNPHGTLNSVIEVQA